MKAYIANYDAWSIVVYKINPNQQEIDHEVEFDRNANGRIFRGCKLEIVNDILVIKDDPKDEIRGIFSLNHYYVLEYKD